MVALLIGCGLRRGALLALQLESIQQREEHRVIADLVGKGGHVRTVPIPTWVKHHVNAWTAAAAITHGRVSLRREAESSAAGEQTFRRIAF
jgi:integrase